MGEEVVELENFCILHVSLINAHGGKSKRLVRVVDTITRDWMEGLALHGRPSSWKSKN